MMYRIKLSILLITLFAVLIIPTTAQEEFPPANVINDEGGPVLLVGDVEYTNPFFTDGVAEPVIILEDQAGFVDRDRYYIFPPESQTLGQITSDFFTSPFSYSLALPITPQAALRDVDNDGEQDTGVMVYAVAYWTNAWGDPYLEERDLSGGGWSSAYASTRVSGDPSQQGEIVGGKFLIYAPDDAQGFPSGYGDDGLLFTDDDPIVSVPQGYSVVNLDEDPFTFDRSRNQTIDLIEPDSAALIDYSDLPYDEAFAAMVDLFRERYAFTDYYGLDWDAIESELSPIFEEAVRTGNDVLYVDGVREFLSRVPDGHVAFGPITALIDEFRFRIIGGIGIAIRETDDGESLVTYLLAGGPAANAGIELGATIHAINGVPMVEHISNQEPYVQQFSTDHNRRLEQMRFATRFNANVNSVDVVYSNPGSDRQNEVTLTPVQEFESYSAGGFPVADTDPTSLPVEYRLLDSGYGYATITGFSDNQLLSVQLWERMINQMQGLGVNGLIIDMRENGGGSGFLADQLSAYFFDDPHIVGGRGIYSEELGEFYFDERSVTRLILPSEDLRYRGNVAILVGPNCASACERFVYNFTIKGRGAIVGQYPSAGLGGGVNDFRMPEGITVRYTVTRSVDVNGNIHIEGNGVAPTVRVPINAETLFSDGDPVLEYAIEWLDSQ